jgi:Uma2 family endonuclease
MTVQLTPPHRTIADLIRDLDGIPPHRIRLNPTPGTATEEDCLRVTEKERPCELINGTLVEKTVGAPESFFAMAVGSRLSQFTRTKRLGFVTGTDGLYRMIHGNIREPDVSFTVRERLPNPLPQIGGWCPDLCVEVLSPDNTRAEMDRKRKEYFSSGCRLVWELNPRKRTADVFTNPDSFTRVESGGALDGGDVLPGFTLPLAELFAEFDDYFPSESNDRA